MNTPNKGLSFDSFVDQKMQQQKQEVARKHAIIAKKQNDAVRRHLTFNNNSSDGSSAESQTPAKKKKNENMAAKCTPPRKSWSNDSGVFSTSPSTPSNPPSKHRFRQLSPEKTDVSSEDSDDSLLALPTEPTPKQRRKVMKRVLASLGINQGGDGEIRQRKNAKRKRKSTDDEPQTKMSAMPLRRRKPRSMAEVDQAPELEKTQNGHQQVMDCIENIEEDYRLNIVFEEPLDGRAWSGEAQVNNLNAVDEDQMMVQEEWLKKLGITADAEMMTDISDISSSNEGAM